ncbi:MAG: hypothetical protein LBI92_06700 [Azoarcus sp.]|jgi:hypothetical protein|nr:hypothetical protein [Azoarcus sp.]
MTDTERARRIDQLATHLINELPEAEEDVAAEAFVCALFRWLGPCAYAAFLTSLPVTSDLLNAR